MEPRSGISGYSAGIGMEPGLGVGGYSAGVDLTAQKLNNISDSVKREFKNTRQNAAIGIQKRKKRRGPSKFERLRSSESDYSKFKTLCFLKYARDYAMGHDDLVEKVQKYFKNSYCKELAIEMMKKTTEAFERKYGKNDRRSNMNFL